MTGNHYEVLGIAEDASPEEIKRAWARGVREHTPDRDPEGNRRLNEARAALLDPDLREAYDRDLHMSPVERDLRARLDGAREAGETGAVVDLLKELLALEPESATLRNQLGVALLEAERWDEGAKVLGGLVARPEGDVALYWGNYGAAQREAARALQPNDFHRPGALAESRRAFGRALELDPENRDLAMGLSLTLLTGEDFEGAIAVAERGVSSDGQDDYEDYELLAHLVMLYARLGRHPNVIATVRRISGVVPPSDAAKRVAARRLVRLANELEDLGYPAEALPVASLATELDPEDEWIAKGLAYFRDAVGVKADFERLDSDLGLPFPVRRMFALYAMNHRGTLEEDEAKAQMDDAFGAMMASPKPNLLAALERVRALYPHLWHLNGPFMDGVLGDLRGQVTPAQRRALEAGILPGRHSRFVRFWNLTLVLAIVGIVMAIVAGTKGSKEYDVWGGLGILWVPVWVVGHALRGLYLRVNR